MGDERDEEWGMNREDEEWGIKDKDEEWKIKIRDEELIWEGGMFSQR